MPGLLVGHKPYHWAKLVSLLQGYGVTDPHIHQRERLLNHEQRAAHLVSVMKRYRDEGKRLHLVGHSAGGLDIELALYMEPSLQKRISSVTTFASPFAGTPIADQKLKGLLDSKIDNLLFGDCEQPSIAERIAYEMTSKYTDEMVKELAVKPGLVQSTYSLLFYIDHIWKAPYFSWKDHRYLISQGFERNDGTVPTDSMRHGHTLTVMPGDHKSESLPFRYGWPFQTQYKEVWGKITAHLQSLEPALP